jgi:hypothetical protein
VQLDDGQRAQDQRRDVLDDQQTPLNLPSLATVPSNEGEHAEAADARGQAIRVRAQAALARAEEAHRRAEEALRRIEASERRQNQPAAERRP